MTTHDYLVLAIAAFWMTVGALGLGFTIRHLHHQDGRARPAVVGHIPLSSVRGWIPVIEGGLSDAFGKWRRPIIFGPVTAIAVAALITLAFSLTGRHSIPEGDRSSAQATPGKSEADPTTRTIAGVPSGAAEKVVPKNPNVVVGLPLYAAEVNDKNKLTEFRYVGRVISISEAPHRKWNSQTVERTLFVTVEDESGVAQTFEYGRVEWRAASLKDNPKLGVVLASASP